MFNFAYLPQALRVFERRLRVGLLGIRRYKGSPIQISRQIINDCWNGRYFTASYGNFRQFWTRDFGICVEPLLNLGYKKQVKSTLKYALDVFSKYSRVTTTIAPYNYPFDFPAYSPDSFPFFLRSLRLSNQKALIKDFKELFDKEVNKYYNIVLDKKTGLVRKEGIFSSLKDNIIRESALYDNIMVAMLNNELKEIRFLENPLKNYNFKRIIKDNFWTGDYFLDDLSGKEYVSGDANTFPFYCGVFTTINMMKKAINKIEDAGLDKPFPLKYTKKPMGNRQTILTSLLTKVLSPNYEGNTNWMHLGLCYIRVVKKIDKNKAEQHITEYTQLINKYKNFLELFNNNGEPYKSLFYYCDEGMLWVVNYLEMMKSK